MCKNLVKERLKKMGQTQKWLALSSGVSERTIRRIIENQDHNPTIQTALRISEALGCHIEKLWPEL
jgi:DNA-binding XRE family transcriptional regulator